MNVGLLGYGKMGRAIEAVAEGSNTTFVWRVGRENRDQLTTELLQRADVVIEFSRPEAAFENVKRCLEAGVPVVSGTTGWLDRLPEAQALCREKNGALLWASNFSVGVNLFFALNRYLAALMNGPGRMAFGWQPQLALLTLLQLLLWAAVATALLVWVYDRARRALEVSGG